MRYFGGKARISKQIAAFLQTHINDEIYFEPFVGAAWVAHRIKAQTKIVNDIHPDLILLWKSLQEGWDPPDNISEETYKALKASQPSALRGFAGFGCSFAGKWFGGYARGGEKRNYAMNAKKSLLKKLDGMKDAIFLNQSYSEFSPSGQIIYCDPPYQDTTTYNCGTFDTNNFWDIIREWSRTNKVFVSEYKAPDDFKSVWTINTKTDIRTKESGKESRIEKIFVKRT